MGDTAERYASLDLNALMRKKGRVVSSKEALRDVKPVEWGDDVLHGGRKVTVTKEKE